MFFKKKEIILKANLLKGRVAKPEGTVCYIIIDRERIRAEDSGDLFLYFQ